MRCILPLCQSIAAHRFSSDSHLDDNTRAIHKGKNVKHGTRQNTKVEKVYNQAAQGCSFHAGNKSVSQTRLDVVRLSKTTMNESCGPITKQAKA